MVMLKIGATELPNPSVFGWSEADLSSAASGRNLAGEMLKDLVAKKVKLTCEWGVLKPSVAMSLLSTVTTSIYLEVTYPDPLTGTTATKTMYVGDRDTGLLLWDSDTGAEYWKDIKFNFIEK